jgi:hypothetical protein
MATPDIDPNSTCLDFFNTLLMKQSVRDQSFKTIEFDPKITKAIGAICRGC